MSRDTKQLLTDTFLRLAEEKPIEKITIREIVSECGLNRNTFYYYFSDIFHLIESILSAEAERVVKRAREEDSIAEGCIAFVEWIEVHRTAFRNIYNAIGRESVEYAMLRVLNEAMRGYVQRKAGGKHIPDEDVSLISAVCCNVFFGALAHWVKHNMRTEPREYLYRLEALYGFGMDEAIRHAASGTVIEAHMKEESK